MAGRATSRTLCLLRGVNLGGTNRVPMADLRAALAAAGYPGATTYLQSGNVIVDTDATEDDVARDVARVLVHGFDVHTGVVVVRARELAEMAAANPLPLPDGGDAKMLLVVLGHVPSPATTAARPLADAGGTTAHAGRAVYQWCPDGVARAPAVVPWIARNWDTNATARNWKTVAALLDLLG